MAPPEPAPTPAQETQPPAAASPPPEESDLTWEDKEDKLDAENIQPNPSEPAAADKKYQYKEGERSGDPGPPGFQIHHLSRSSFFRTMETNQPRGEEEI